MKLVAGHWALSLNQAEGHELIVKATAQNLCAKLGALRDWRKAGKLGGYSLTFALETPVFLVDLAQLLEVLLNKVRCEARIQLAYRSCPQISFIEAKSKL